MQLRTPDHKEVDKQPNFQTTAGLMETYVSSFVKWLSLYFTLLILRKIEHSGAE